MIIYTGSTVSGTFNLGAMLARGMKDRFVVIMRITPEIAEEMLEKNTSNRPLSNARVKRRRDAIIEGRYKLTPQAIAFSRSGKLLDGQHRLNAVIMADKWTVMTVWFGCEEDECEFIDVDLAPRTAADILHIKGHENTTHLAAIGRLISIAKGERVVEVQTQTAYAELIDDPVIHHGIAVAKVGKEVASIATLATAYWFVASQTEREPDMLNEFFGKLTTGADIPPGWFLKFRAKLARNKIHSRGSYTTQVKVVGQIIEAWNAYSDGKGRAPSWSPTWDDANAVPGVK